MSPDEILGIAAGMVKGERRESHGNFEDTMQSVAVFWTEYLGHPVSAQDAARMMTLMKIARASNGMTILDHDLDGAAYLAIAGSLESRKGNVELPE